MEFRIRLCVCERSVWWHYSCGNDILFFGWSYNTSLDLFHRLLASHTTSEGFIFWSLRLLEFFQPIPLYNCSQFTSRTLSGCDYIRQPIVTFNVCWQIYAAHLCPTGCLQRWSHNEQDRVMGFSPLWWPLPYYLHLLQSAMGTECFVWWMSDRRQRMNFLMILTDEFSSQRTSEDSRMQENLMLNSP